ncbi:MAG TPA: hypothetical protein VMB02_15110 [Candidatus Aquilonibacter sp.]|nr:hypothetical protein [Candidatus Aquilonibacter sp.]
MRGDILDLLCQAANEMRDFLRCINDPSARSGAVDASRVKTLTTRLRQVGEAVRAGSPEATARARASSVYGEYKELLGQVHAALQPFQNRLIGRKSEIDAARTQVGALSAWTAAYERTR